MNLETREVAVRGRPKRGPRAGKLIGLVESEMGHAAGGRGQSIKVVLQSGQEPVIEVKPPGTADVEVIRSDRATGVSVTSERAHISVKASATNSRER